MYCHSSQLVHVHQQETNTHAMLIDELNVMLRLNKKLKNV